MPIDYSEYPHNWKSEIVPKIRARAENKCEWCGVQNHSIIRRNGDGTYEEIVAASDALDFLRREGSRSLRAAGFTYIICTTAHLDTPFPDGRPGNKHDKMDVRDEALCFLCQKCHLGYDLADHIQHRRENRETQLGILKMDLG